MKNIALTLTFVLFVSTLLFSAITDNDISSLQYATQKKTKIRWVELSDVQELMAKKPKKVLMLFYRQNCPYCKEMKETTLQDPEVVKLVNDNFYAVMVDGKTKEALTFMGETYLNDHPNPEDKPWIHNLYRKYVEPYNGGYYWPSTVIFDKNLNKEKSFPGLQKTVQFKRLLKIYSQDRNKKSR